MVLENGYLMPVQIVCEDKFNSCFISNSSEKIYVKLYLRALVCTKFTRTIFVWKVHITISGFTATDTTLQWLF